MPSEKTIDDAPIHYTSEEAHAWVAGYNTAYEELIHDAEQHREHQRQADEQRQRWREFMIRIGADPKYLDSDEDAPFSLDVPVYSPSSDDDLLTDEDLDALSREDD